MNREFNPKNQKYLDGLFMLYESLKKGEYYTPTQMVNDYQLNSYFATFIVKEKIVLRKRERGGLTYTWNSIRPNEQMAMKLLDLCRQKSKSNNRSKKARQSNPTEAKKTIVSENQKSTFSEETKKTLEFLLEVYFKCKNKEEGFVRPLIDSYGIHKNASQVLMHYEYMTRIDGTREYEWLKTIPNHKMTEQFIVDMKDFRKKVARKYTEKKQEKAKTTTITKSYFFGLFKTTKQVQ